jgi:hypothetical protein
MAALLALFPPVGHDQLWCLYVAQRMLAGAKLYGPELFESNPPFIMWASLFLAHVAQLTHIPITVLFKLAVSSLGLASALISLNILRRIYPTLTQATLWFLAFAYIVIFAVMPARDFGQRDHLLAILCLPYVLAAALDAIKHQPQNRVPHISPLRCGFDPTPLPTSLRLLIAIAAAIGICLKPHNALLLLTTELLLLVYTARPRRFLPRVELSTILATGALYLLAVHKLTPDYLTEVVPLLKDVYWAIGHLSPFQLLGESIQLHILLAITLTALIGRGRHDRPAIFLLAAGIASTVAYYLQGTGWYYQQIPALSFTAAALALLILPATDGCPIFATASSSLRWAEAPPDSKIARLLNHPTTPIAALALSLLALVLTAHFTDYPFVPSRSFPIEAPDESFFTSLPPNTPVAILTTSVDDTVMPTAKYHLLWAQRTNNLWILPALLRNESGPPPQRAIPPTRLAELEALQRRFMVEDLNRWHPKLILVNRCQDLHVRCQVIEDRHDDLLAWFSQDPAFRVAFTPYRYAGSKGDFDAYTLP